MFYESWQKPYFYLMFSARKNKFMCLFCILFILMQPTGLISKLLHLVFSELGLLEATPSPPNKTKQNETDQELMKLTNTC